MSQEYVCKRSSCYDPYLEDVGCAIEHLRSTHGEGYIRRRLPSAAPIVMDTLGTVPNAAEGWIVHIEFSIPTGLCGTISVIVRTWLGRTSVGHREHLVLDSKSSNVESGRMVQIRVNQCIVGLGIGVPG